MAGGAFSQNAPSKTYLLRKRICAGPYLNWLLPAWVFYLMGAVGYVIIDMLTALDADVSDYQYSVAFALLAAIYFVDSIFYYLAWWVAATEKRDHEGVVVQIDSAAWGELLYVFAAIFGLIAAGCEFLVPYGGDNRIARAISSIFALQAWSSMLLISNTLYLVDSFVYWSAWHGKYVTTPRDERPKICFDGYFWADGILLTIPSIGYFVTSFVVVFGLYVVSLQSGDVPIAALLGQYRQLLRISRAFNVVFDFIYVVDAAVYGLAWWADVEVIKELRIERGQDLPEIDLGESFEIERRE